MSTSPLLRQLVRGLAITGISVGLFGLAYRIWALYYGDYTDFVYFDFLYLLRTVYNLCVLGGYAALLVGSVALWRGQLWARRCILIWGYATIFAAFCNLTFDQFIPVLFQHNPRFNSVQERNIDLTEDVAWFAQNACFPLLAVFLLMHSDVAKLFGQDELRGFEVLPVARLNSITQGDSSDVSNQTEYPGVLNAGPFECHAAKGIAMTGLILSSAILSQEVMYFLQGDFWVGVDGFSNQVERTTAAILLLIGSWGLCRQRSWARRCVIAWAIITIIYALGYMFIYRIPMAWHRTHLPHSTLRPFAFYAIQIVSFCEAEIAVPLTALFVLLNRDMANICVGPTSTESGSPLEAGTGLESKPLRSLSS